MDYHPIHFLACFIYFLLNFLFPYFASTSYKELALLPFHYLNHVNLHYKTSYQFPSVLVRFRSHRLTSRTTVGSESLALTLTVSRLASFIKPPRLVSLSPRLVLTSFQPRSRPRLSSIPVSSASLRFARLGSPTFQPRLYHFAS